MSSIILTETMILPTGAEDRDFEGYRDFALYVRWQRSLGWTVTTNSREERLSVKGRKWQSYVERRNRRFYYFPSYEEALAAAREEVDRYTVYGRTWAQWDAQFNPPV